MVPDLLCSSPPCLLIPAMLLDPPEEWGEWLKLLEFEGDAGLLANVGNLTGLVPLLTVVWKTKWKIICSFLIEVNKIAAEVCSLFFSSSETSTEEQRGYQKESYFTYTYRQNIYLYKYIYILNIFIKLKKLHHIKPLILLNLWPIQMSIYDAPDMIHTVLWAVGKKKNYHMWSFFPAESWLCLSLLQNSYQLPIHHTSVSHKLSSKKWYKLPLLVAFLYSLQSKQPAAQLYWVLLTDALLI